MVSASDIKFYYSAGPNPVADNTNPTPVELAAASLGGPPRSAISANQLVDFTPPSTNLNNLFDDVLETQNQGQPSDAAYKDYRCIYIRNEDADPGTGTPEERALITTLYRARAYSPSATTDLDATTSFKIGCLPLTAATGLPRANFDERATTVADSATGTPSTAPTLTGGGAITFTSLPGAPAATPTLAPNGTDSFNLVRDRYLGIWIERTVTKIVNPVGKTETLAFTIIGGTPAP